MLPFLSRNTSLGADGFSYTIRESNSSELHFQLSDVFIVMYPLDSGWTNSEVALFSVDLRVKN